LAVEDWASRKLEAGDTGEFGIAAPSGDSAARDPVSFFF
jgi:hypothetical protein